MKALIGALLCLAACASPVAPLGHRDAPPAASSSGTTAAEPGAVAPVLHKLTAAHEARLDAIVKAAIDRGEVPGAVVAVLRERQLVFLRAYGERSVKPARSPMQDDTVFDLASLTKPIATATAIMILRDRKKLSLDDRVDKHLPACAIEATLEELLAHASGLPAANDLRQYADGRAAAMNAICGLERGKRGVEVYSDLGYILLAQVVAAASGQAFDLFCAENIFAPLGMKDTGFKPTPELAARAAPTELRDGAWLEGSVHDPRAALLDGVAGHAGLFGTAGDLARFAAMLLGGGSLEGKRILSAESVGLLRGAHGATRSLGYQLVAGGYGHTGFTGTSLWLDARGSGVIILTSRLHPDGKGNANVLRRDVRALIQEADRAQPAVGAGIDALADQDFAPLVGRSIGLITHHAARARDGRRTADVLHGAGLDLVAIFTPEHGMAAAGEGGVADARDSHTGLPIYSLYGKQLRPTAAQLKGIDTLVYDLVSIGTRFYTYETTLGYSLETAAKRDLQLIVLDRPNPIGGVMVEGPVLDAGRESFIAYHPIPVRHGMTVGELAQLFNGERQLGAKLTVIAARAWERPQRHDATGLPWVDPSPNIRSLAAALLYPGLGLLERTNVSVGRGTDAPFLRVGAPWLDPSAIIAELSAAGLDGVTFAEESFTPSASTHAGVACRGVHFTVGASEVESVRLGIALAVALRKVHKAAWKPQGLLTMLGHRAGYEAILAGKNLDEVVQTWSADLDEFAAKRKPYLLY